MAIEQDSDSLELMETTQGAFSHSLWENPMGETRKDALRLDFNGRLKLDFHGKSLTLRCCFGIMGLGLNRRFSRRVSKRAEMPFMKSNGKCQLLVLWKVVPARVAEA